MYLLINHDHSLNYVGEHPIDNHLCFEGVTLIEKHEHTLADVMGDIPIELAAWDYTQEQVIHNPRLLPSDTDNNEETTT